MNWLDGLQGKLIYITLFSSQIEGNTAHCSGALIFISDNETNETDKSIQGSSDSIRQEKSTNKLSSRHFAERQEILLSILTNLQDTS